MSTTTAPTLTRASSGVTDERVDDMPVLLAVSYLRVSTREQAERGGTEEGFSIPAQRDANQRKADELGARVVREFVDAGESARSADRDGLQDMLAFINATRVQFRSPGPLARQSPWAPHESGAQACPNPTPPTHQLVRKTTRSPDHHP